MGVGGGGPSRVYRTPQELPNAFQEIQISSTTVKEKRKDHALARKQALIEHIFGILKMFRILSER